ncbi:S8/S53 family peptidase [Flavobacterium sp.]|uniref:S8/S53 family peptidase n=1 Tax=Flavobacterium sp. TaxID=239 RepID=UPI001205771E|nr:S8/S53 family peptidase [Flavobacterium sp.]RZJ70938.1 MAG: T9SS type A sorting domain-containing protein [Flavobacterium sp.]
MNRILLVCFAFSFAFSVAQNRKGQFRIKDQDFKHSLIVAFADADFDVDELQSQYQFSLGKAFPMSEEKKTELARTSTDSGKALELIGNIYKVDLQNPTDAILLELAAKLEMSNRVRYCEILSSRPVPPPADIAPTTPNYFANQTYIQANPGVNMQAAWNLGIVGNGIKVRDVEYGFNKNHEEFVDNPSIFMQSGVALNPEVSQDYSEHGTAVFGIIAADNGTYGVTGMAHGVSEMIQFPEWTQSFGYSPATAVLNAISASSQGDVILLEMQEYGVNDQFVPSEYLQSIWDLTNAATNSGILIVAAAGNGNANLDSANYAAYMNRGDSGAIIVGAGTANLQHDRISYSTFGNRVNLQAWGSNVRSSGYGTFSQIGGDFNQRYCTFTGTSSATPIVASCAIALQSHYRNLTGNYLAPTVLRQILINTGIAQGSGGHIGPIPNMVAALTAVNDLAVQKSENLVFALYPNPADAKVAISGIFSDAMKVEILNTFGQTVLKSGSVDLDVSDLQSGVYFVRISDGAKIGVKRLVKL